MNAARGGTKVRVAITLGDSQWDAAWDAVLGEVGFPKQIRYRKPSGPRNLIVDGTTQSAAVQSGGAGAYAAVPGAARAFAAGAINPQTIPV